MKDARWNKLMKRDGTGSKMYRATKNIKVSRETKEYLRKKAQEALDG